MSMGGLEAELVRAAGELAAREAHPSRSAWRYASAAAFALAEGRLWPWQPGLAAGYGRGEPRQCFRNAALLALGNPALCYVEGYAARAGLPLPFLHAWAVRGDGLVIDVTWTEAPGEERAYLGVPFRAGYLSRALIGRGRYGLIDVWESGWPLLRGADPVAEAVRPWPLERGAS